MADIELVIKIPEDAYKSIKRRVANPKAMIDKIDIAIANGTLLDNLRTELEDYITHSPYIKTFMDCCRLRDDVLQIIDKYKAGEKQE